MKKNSQQIWVYNNGKYEQEKITAEKWMRLIYENPIGKATLPFLIKRKIFSHLYGMYCRMGISAHKIPKFIEEHSIDMTGCPTHYKNFADFFSRGKKDIVFPTEPHILGSPCEGLVSVYKDIDPNSLIAAKDSLFSLKELFKDEVLANSYTRGIMLKIRLTPANYHRMHFFDEAVVKETRAINGDLFSVSPLALNHIARLYCRNKRALVMLSTQNFGDVAVVEVGATFVGSIVHLFNDNEKVYRGQQASYFLPGGSLVLIFFKNGTMVPNEALVEQTLKGFETKTPISSILGAARFI